MVKVWNARHTKIRIGLASGFTATTTTSTMYNLVTSPTQLECKAENITVVEPEGAVEKIDLLGVDDNSFQCAELDKKPFGLVTISGTLVQDEDQVLEEFFSASSTGATVGTTVGYTRWQEGNGSRPLVAIVVQMIDGESEVNLALASAYLTKIGDRRIDSADGHWQQDFEAVGLVKNYYVEYRVNEE